MFLNKQKAIPTTQVPTISRNHMQPAKTSSRRNILGSGRSEQLLVRIFDETSKTRPKFNATGQFVNEIQLSM